MSEKNVYVATTGERITEIMIERQMTQTDLVNLCKPLAEKRNMRICNADISAYILGKYQPGQRKLALLADALGVSLGWLMGGDVPRQPEIKLPAEIIPIDQMQHHYVPIIGSVAAGTPVLCDENYDVYIDAPNKADYALRVQGDSMTPTFLDGDVLYICQQDDLNDGNIGVVLIDDSACVKHIYHLPHGLMLVSDNPAYPPRSVTNKDCDTLRILGKVCGYTRMF